MAAGSGLRRVAAWTFQEVERIASVPILPHPEEEKPAVVRQRPNPETEAVAMRVAIEHGRAPGRAVADAHEVKGLHGPEGTIILTPNERRVAEDRPECYWLYVVTDCDNAPRLQESIRDPARPDWNEVTKVAHYYLSVDAMTRAMQVREDTPQYGGRK